MSKLWGGRFSKETSEQVDAFNASIGFDCRLWEQDIRGSIAHARMLGLSGIIPSADADKIVKGLEEISRDIKSGKVEFDISAEDIHMNIEKLLHQKIGDVAGRLHTARSRNDQVALDLRMYVKEQIRKITEEIEALQETLVKTAEQHIHTLMPSYTHLQHAQPITLAHHLLAYVWMLQRDRGRLSDCLVRTDVMPLGSGAVAGTSFPIDRYLVAEQLDFPRISENSMDAVSDRDFAIEFLSAGAILGMHLSRFAEELIIWNTKEFGYIELDDSMATGSSLMPQKKNPDIAELIRGKCGRLYGNLVTMLTVMKGLPLAYNKDLQEDKEPVFDTVDTLLQCLGVLRALIECTEFRVERMKESLTGDFSTATDLADALVRKGVPFRSAHETAGRIVAYCIENKRTLEDLSSEELEKFAPELGQGASLDPASSVEARDIPGSTSPGRIQEQISAAYRIIHS